jgi:hypothetical protein
MLQLGKEKEFCANSIFNMKILKTLLVCLTTTFSIWLLCGCSTSRLDSSNANQFNTETALTNASAVSLTKDQSGAERVFTNANVVMWVPSNAVQVWDGPTSGVYIGETTPPGAFVKDYKIELDIGIIDTPERLQQQDRWSASNWFYQDHPQVSMIDVQYGKQLRRDIWSHEKTRRLLISASVTRSATFEEDVKTAKKMIESIKLIPK